MDVFAMKTRGFTLIEVSLAIVIGVIVLAGGIVLFNQVKISSGNSAAADKVSALQTLVEEMEVRNYKLPRPADLYQNLVSRRSDVTQSPWGGPAGGLTGGAMFGSVGDGFTERQQGFEGSDYTPNPTDVTTFGAHADPLSTSMLVYYRAFLTGEIPSDATQSVWDQARGNTIVAKRYWVGIIGPVGSTPAQSGQCYFFPRSIK